MIHVILIHFTPSWKRKKRKEKKLFETREFENAGFAF